MYTIEIMTTDFKRWERIKTEFETVEEALAIAKSYKEAISKEDGLFVKFANKYGIKVKCDNFIDIRVSEVAKIMTIKKNSWHYKFTKLTTSYEKIPKSICGYTWNIIGKLALWLFIFSVIAVFGFLVGAGVFDKFGVSGSETWWMMIVSSIVGCITLALGIGGIVFGGAGAVGGVYYLNEKYDDYKTAKQKKIAVKHQTVSEEVFKSFKGKHCNLLKYED